MQLPALWIAHAKQWLHVNVLLLLFLDNHKKLEFTWVYTPVISDSKTTIKRKVPFSTYNQNSLINVVIPVIVNFSQDEVKDWVFPTSYDYLAAEANHLIYHADSDGVCRPCGKYLKPSAMFARNGTL